MSEHSEKQVKNDAGWHFDNSYSRLPELLYVRHSPVPVRSKIGLDWLSLQAAQIHADSEWLRSARTILIDDLAQIQVKLTNRVLAENDENDVNNCW